MAKDYAKKTTGQRHKTVKKKQRPVLRTLLFSFLLLFVGYFYLDASLFGRYQQRLAAYWNELQQKVPKVAEQSKTASKPRFEFYTLLSENRSDIANSDQGVVVHKSGPSPVNKQEPVAPSRVKQASLAGGKRELPSRSKYRYQLQVASLRNYKDADSLKARLVMDGFSVKINTFERKGVTWYRVNVGPYASIEKAGLVQGQLHRDHFDSIMKRLG